MSDQEPGAWVENTPRPRVERGFWKVVAGLFVWMLATLIVACEPSVVVSLGLVAPMQFAAILLAIDGLLPSD